MRIKNDLGLLRNWMPDEVFKEKFAEGCWPIVKWWRLIYFYIASSWNATEENVFILNSYNYSQPLICLIANIILRLFYYICYF